MIKAIPTVYKGHQFRSRLEATWAAMFDQLKWPWLYEPFDLQGYIPDFILNFPYKPLLVEVKPELRPSDLYQYSSKIEESGWDNDYMLVGVGPLEDDTYWNPLIGLITEWNTDDDDQPARWLSEALLFRCLRCGNFSVHHGPGSWVCRYGGCYDGDGHIDHVEDYYAKYMWGIAHAATQYHSRALPPKKDVIQASRLLPATLNHLAHQTCPKCGVTPQFCSNRSSPIVDCWIACPDCGFEGEHDDSFAGAFAGWDTRCARA